MSRRQLLRWMICVGLLNGKALARERFQFDGRGRILAPVFVNGRGPFRFMFDTGAEVSAVSEFLARELRLPTAASYDVRGVIGQRPTHAVLANELRCDSIRMAQLRVAVLGQSQIEDLDGLLGADLLRNGIVDIDFGARELAMQVAAAPTKPIPMERLRLTLKFNGLLAVPVRIGAARAWAILDSGAPHSIGNQSLRQMLGIRASFDPSTDAMITDAAGAQKPAVLATAPVIQLGRRSLPAAPLRFADLSVFDRWGWVRQPAILLGMDRLVHLNHLRIDYPNRLLRLSN